MRVNLQTVGLSDAIEFGTEDYHEDQSALAALLHIVSEEMQAGLTQKESTAYAWEAIRVVRIGDDQIKEATTNKLCRDFADLRFKVGECVEYFSLRVSAIEN
jgi:hypothetical protein